MDIFGPSFLKKRQGGILHKKSLHNKHTTHNKSTTIVHPFWPHNPNLFQGNTCTYIQFLTFFPLIFLFFQNLGCPIHSVKPSILEPNIQPQNRGPARSFLISCPYEQIHFSAILTIRNQESFYKALYRWLAMLFHLESLTRIVDQKCHFKWGCQPESWLSSSTLLQMESLTWVVDLKFCF